MPPAPRFRQLPATCRLAALALLALLGGCMQRIIAIDSNPPGALVYLNDLEVGRTPMTKEFLWYGDYEVVLRLDGYQTLKTDAPVPAPWWQYIPLDLFTEALPVKDVHRFTFNLTPTRPEPPQGVLIRGEQLESMLQATRLPQTKPKPTPRPPARRSPTTAPAATAGTAQPSSRPTTTLSHWP
jgi:hypothetical protein